MTAYISFHNITLHWIMTKSYFYSYTRFAKLFNKLRQVSRVSSHQLNSTQFCSTHTRKEVVPSLPLHSWLPFLFLLLFLALSFLSTFFNFVSWNSGILGRLSCAFVFVFVVPIRHSDMEKTCKSLVTIHIQIQTLGFWNPHVYFTWFNYLRMRMLEKNVIFFTSTRSKSKKNLKSYSFKWNKIKK